MEASEKQREGCEKVYNNHAMDLQFLSSFSHYWRKFKCDRESTYKYGQGRERQENISIA